VEPYDTRDRHGRVHVVEVEYLDDCRHPETDQLLWEVEGNALVLGNTSLPAVDANRPDAPTAVQAFINAHRWTRLNRLRAIGDVEDEPLLGVWNSAIQVHAYQLEPVLRALAMPRVSLLLADGVGLGKTIQAGLVLEELLLRRRIRRVLVLCPAMLQRQWKAELRRKFNLEFEVIDSEATFQLRKRLGVDTNPWRAFPRVIASMDYLRMPDVLQQFLQASGAGPDAEADPRARSPHAAWDLLIVDEAHHFAPQGGGRTSQRTRMLREIRFLFEHRVFASATPHNGKTASFTGLLELLDPVRFQMTADMDATDRDHLGEVRVRRLKSDVNRQSLRPPFAEQDPPIELPIRLSAEEADLYEALRAYRNGGRQQTNGQLDKGRQWFSKFIYALLTKRLLSCPLAFARTWWRHVEEGEETDERDLFAMGRVSAERAEEDARSDDERSALEQDAARYGGSWLRSRGATVAQLQEKVGRALERLGYGRKVVEAEGRLAELAAKADAKTERLIAWIKQHLFVAGKLRDDERLIVFTEYKETLEFLRERLLQEGFDGDSMRMLYGGMHPDEFEQVKAEFEDGEAPVRLLLATDAASEGVNLQEHCRWIIHYDIPWSPSKLQQRNGRVSRHGQVRTVQVHYFRCDQDEDMAFLLRVAEKVEQVREDLGSVERVFDAALHRHFQGKRVSAKELDDAVDLEIQKSPERQDLGHTSADEIGRLTKRASELLESTDSRLGISGEALADVLRAALAVEGQGSLDEIVDRPGFYHLRPPARWAALVDQSLTVGVRRDRPELIFDARLVEQQFGTQRVLRLKPHQVLMRLGHPVMRQALATLTRQLHDPSSPDPIYRWSLAALDRTGFEALMVFHYTLTAINELREPLHDEALSAVFRVEGDHLERVEPHFEQEILRGRLLEVSASRRDDWVRLLRPRWYRHRQDIEAFLKQQAVEHREALAVRATDALKRDKTSTRDSYNARIKELEDRSRTREIDKLARQLIRQQVEREAGRFLFEELEDELVFKASQLEEEIELLKRDVEQTRRQLVDERDFRVDTLLPRRFQLRDVRVLPLALVYVIPATAEEVRR
jgi:superfamily II DNA or RNA helicase